MHFKKEKYDEQFNLTQDRSVYLEFYYRILLGKSIFENKGSVE